MVSDSANSDAAASFSVGAKVLKLTSGGAAEKAGVKEGDIVTKFNGATISSASELTAAVRQEKAGAKATLELIRDGKTVTLNVVLGDAGNQ
jgi:putative serine protease PepD